MAWLRPLLSKFTAPLKPLERRLISILGDELSPAARDILNRRISRINLAQRHTEAKELCLYQIRWGKPVFDPDCQFPNKTAELKLATVRFTTESGIQLTADFWVIEGYFFSITFEKSPKPFLDQKQLHDIQIAIHNDPMSVVYAQPLKKSKGKHALTGWPRDERFFSFITESYESLPVEERTRAVRQIDATLPEDYLELVNQTEGLALGPHRIFGLMEIREVVLKDATYYALAEIADLGFIGVQKSEQQTQYYFLDFDRPNGSFESGRFLDVLLKYIEKSVIK